MSTVPTQPVAATQPRLSIIHLLGWTLGCAIVLGAFRLLIVDPNDAADWQGRLGTFGFGLIYGTALGGLGLLFWRRLFGGYPFPTQPGHWLLVLAGIACLIDGGISAALTLHMRWAGENQINVTACYVLRACGWGSAAAICLAVLWRLQSSRRWWVLTTLTALVLLANTSCWAWLAVYYYWHAQTAVGVGIWAFLVPFASECAGSMVCLLALGVVVRLDIRSDEKRDWLHWAGIGTVLSLGVLHATMMTWNLVYLLP